MKKILALVTGLLLAAAAHAQTFPVKNITIAGSMSGAGVVNAFQNHNCPSIMDYGGNNTGSADNTTAFASTAAAGPTGQACVYFPPGTYAFSSSVSYTLPNASASIRVEGAGPGQSILSWAAGGGLTINYVGLRNTAQVENLSFITGSTPASGTGLTLNQTYSNVSAAGTMLNTNLRNLVFAGSDFTGDAVGWNNAWNVGIHDNGVTNVNIYDSSFNGAAGTNGVGLYLTGSSGAQAMAINLHGDNFQFLGNAGVIYTSYTQGVAITSSNFTGDNIGVEIVSPNAQQDELVITNSQFNCYSYGVLDEVGTGGLILHGNYFLIPAANGYSSSPTGILLQKVNGASIVGNVFQLFNSPSTGTIGIDITGSSTIPGVITGNVFAQLTAGVDLGASSNAINVQSNSYVGNTTNVLNSGTGNTIGGGSQ